MISFGAAGAVVNSSSGGTSVSPVYPTGITAGQLLVLIIGQKPSTANGGTVTTPAGWTLAGSVLAKGGYSTTLGAATGNTNLYFFTKVAAGSETGTLAVTLAVNGVSWAQISRWTTTSTGWDTFALVSTEWSTSSTGTILVTSSESLAVQGQDALLCAFVVASAGGGNYFEEHTISVAGAYLTPTVEISEPSTTTGNDIGGAVAYARLGNGSATAPVVWEMVLEGASTNLRGPVGFLRLRENPVPTSTAINKLAAAELVEAENPAFAAPVQKMSAVQVLLAENAASASVQKLAALEILLAESVPPAPTNDLWVWNGTAEVPANVTVWNGTTEVPASLEVV